MSARALVIVLLFLAGCVGAAPGDEASDFASTQQAATGEVRVLWSGAGSIPHAGGGFCTQCGADYACNSVYAGGSQWGNWENGRKTFLDPHPPGSLVIGVTVRVSACTWSKDDWMQVSLNNTIVGHAKPGVACSCKNGPCAVTTTTLTNVDGLPGYVYGGTNTLSLVSTGPNYHMLCVNHADIELVTADSPMPSASPDALSFDTRDMGTSSPSQPVTITNPGPYATILEGVTSPPGFVVSGPAFPVVLQADETATFEVVFQPVFNGAADADLVFVTSVGELHVPVSGTGRGPALSVSPAEVVLPDADFGSSSTAPLHLSNTGLADLVVTSLGSDSEEFEAPASLPLTIAPGGHAVATVTFTPTRRGARTGTLLIGSNAHPLPLEVFVSGQGRGAAVSIGVYELAFPKTPLNAWSDLPLELTNDGELALVITGVVMGGSGAADFSSPTAFPLTIAPGASDVVTVRFTPQWSEQRRAELSLESNAAQLPFRLPMSGTGITSRMSRTPTSWDFGPVSPAGPAVTREFTFTSTGEAPLVFRGASFFGLDVAAFELVSHPFPVTLAPGESATATVAFLPTRAGSHSVDFQFDSDADNNSASRVVLTGTGAAGALKFSAGERMDLGFAKIGTPTANRDVVVRNSGNVDVEISALTIVGDDAASFTLVDPTVLPTTIAPDATMTVRLSATPSSEGEETATLRVTSNAWGAATSDLALSVTGYAASYTVSASTLSFGRVRVPDVVTRTLVVTNAIWSPETFELHIEGDDAEVFSVSPQPFTVPSHGSATLSVTFAPSEAIDATATLTLVKGSTAIPVALEGRAVTSALAATPTSVDFGEVQVDAWASRLMTLSNVLDEAVTVERVRVSDPAFVVDPQPPFTVEPGGNVDLEIRFTPGKLDAYAAHLRFVLEGEVEPDAVVAVSGQGVSEVATPDAGEDPEEAGDRDPGCGCGGSDASWALLLPMLVALVFRRRNA